MIIIAGNVGEWGGTNEYQGRSGEFSVSRPDTGIYQITFTTGFSVSPTVVVTQHGEPGFSSLDNAIVFNNSRESFQVKTGDINGHARNRNFSFIAIGYR